MPKALKDAVVGLRERKKAQTRDAIILAALDLFEQKGYDATTVEEIAEAAEVSPRTFFRYFDSKVEVVMAPKDERDELGAALAERPPDEGPLEAMRQTLRAGLGAMLTDNLTRVRQSRVMLSTPSLRAMAREHFNEHETEMAVEFARRLGVREGDMRPQVMASAVGNVIWTTATLWVAENGPPERLLDMLDEAFDLLASGFERPTD